MPNTFSVSNQQIPWTYFHLIKKMCGGGRQGEYHAKRIFYRARKADNVKRYSMWLVKNGQIGMITRKMEDDKSFMEKWIDMKFDSIPAEPKREGRQKVESISSILKGE